MPDYDREEEVPVMSFQALELLYDGIHTDIKYCFMGG